MIIEEILKHFQSVKKTTDGYIAKCPCHDDKHPSLSLTAGDDGRILLKCHAGCSTENIMSSIGLEMRDLFSKKLSSKVVVDHYEYLDENGNFVACKTRYSDKSFSWKRPDGKRGWIFDLKGVQIFLYNFPEVLTNDLIYVVEGEKDVETFKKFGKVATCSPHGAGPGKWQAQANKYFKDKAVLIISDNDLAGKDHAIETANNLRNFAKSVKVLDLLKIDPELPESGDTTDIIDKLGEAGMKEIERLADKTAEYEPVAKEIVSAAKENLLEPSDHTDVGQAEVLGHEYGKILRYSQATKWIIYNGKVWEESEIKAQGLAQELTERQLKCSRKMLKIARATVDEEVESGDLEVGKKDSPGEKHAKQYRKFILGRRKSSNIAATLIAARPALEIAAECLDADGFLLNTPAGTVDLRTGEMRQHNSDDFCTKMTAVSPGDDGAEEFAEFLKVITDADKALENYHQLNAGESIIGKVLYENVKIAKGSGKNGKSTLYNLEARVLGTYSGFLSAETLTVNCRKNKSPEYAELRGKRLVIAAELEEGMRLDTAIVKKLCSTDPVYAEKKYKDPFSFTPTHTVVLYTNHLPRVGTTDVGTWRRLTVIPFDAVISEESDIKNYADYLFRNAGGAVLSWMIEGAKKFIAADFKIEPPECVKRAIEDYRATNDWLDDYLTERCEINKMYDQKAGELYADYRDYCKNTGSFTRSSADFKAAIESAGYETKKTNNGNWVYGLRLLPVEQIGGWHPFKNDEDDEESDGR
jgi:P4 family phage/plasmid primase-like protien